MQLPLSSCRCTNVGSGHHHSPSLPLNFHIEPFQLRRRVPQTQPTTGPLGVSLELDMSLHFDSYHLAVRIHWSAQKLDGVANGGIAVVTDSPPTIPTSLYQFENLCCELCYSRRSTNTLYRRAVLELREWLEFVTAFGNKSGLPPPHPSSGTQRSEHSAG